MRREVRRRMTTSQISALIDRFLLGEEPDRAAVFAQVATWEPEQEAASPIVRAIKLIGDRAANESLMALRIIIAGHPLEDEHLHALRSILKRHSDGDTTARQAYDELLSSHE